MVPQPVLRLDFHKLRKSKWREPVGALWGISGFGTLMLHEI
jgi:hypothetical protein